MKIIVFVATGDVSQSVVRQGIEAGFKVTAFVLIPSKLDFSHENLKIIQKNAFNQGEVSEEYMEVKRKLILSVVIIESVLF